ncbi:hypothetical protein ACX3O0_14870 [Homoserinimonas sp. A447]
MTMDLRWLTAPDQEVAAAMAAVRHDSRPTWVPTRRQVLAHVNRCLILWYLCIVFMVIGIRVDGYQDGQVMASDISALMVSITILAAWLYGTYWLQVWAGKPSSPRARLKQWRQTLTALANGYESRPSQVATFSSLISAGSRRVHQYPRYVADGVEFGNLVRGTARSNGWHYLAVKLPAPLPHLTLDATSNNRMGSDLPAGVERGQRLSLEGDFDRWFQAYSLLKYRNEAHYILTPDVMADLIDNAGRFNVEIVDDNLVFFTSPAVDFTEAEHWHSLHAVLTTVAPRITAKARRYLDERVPGQEVPRMLSAIRAELENPGIAWVPPEPRIGPDGRRLNIRDRNKGVWPIIGAVGWFTLLAFLYAVPGIFAFAGLMSIIDGR